MEENSPPTHHHPLPPPPPPHSRKRGEEIRKVLEWYVVNNSGMMSFIAAEAEELPAVTAILKV